MDGAANGKRPATLKEIYSANNSGFLLTWEASRLLNRSADLSGLFLKPEAGVLCRFPLSSAAVHGRDVHGRIQYNYFPLYSSFCQWPLNPDWTIGPWIWGSVPGSACCQDAVHRPALFLGPQLSWALGASHSVSTQGWATQSLDFQNL